MSSSVNAAKRFFFNKSAVISLLIIMLYLITAVGFEIVTAVSEISGTTPIHMRTSSTVYSHPDAAHLLGTDYQGRDVLLRASAACSTALKVGLVSGVIAAVIGVSIGACAGYFGGKTDDIAVWIYSTFASMPSLLFILAFALLVSRGYLSPALLNTVKAAAACLRIEPSTFAVYCAIGLTGWVTLCRTVRAESMKLKKMPYVEAAKVAGVNSITIILRHIIPNVFHLVIIYFTLTFAGAVMLEVIVSYLGFGVQNAPSWGVMISDGQEQLWRGIWWELAAATGFLFILVLALNILGDALRDAFDPKC